MVAMGKWLCHLHQPEHSEGSKLVLDALNLCRKDSKANIDSDIIYLQIGKQRARGENNVPTLPHITLIAREFPFQQIA